MANDDLISVIVPVFNVAPYLRRCLGSLLDQTHQLFEIILVDDGSTDRSGEICDQYAAQDERVRVIHQANSGVSAARNAGIKAARGGWLTFVDSDDWVAPELISHLLVIARDTGSDLAACKFVRVVNERAARGQRRASVKLLGVEEALAMYAGPTTSWMTSPCAKLFRAELLEDVRFPVGRRYEDEFTTYRLVAAASRVVVSDAELYFYFTRPDSATQGEQQVRQLLDRVDALREQADFFTARGMGQVADHALKRAFLILRQLRGRVAASGDQVLQCELARDIKAVAVALWASGQPTSVKVLARFYSIWPQPLDAAVSLYQSFGRLPRTAAVGEGSTGFGGAATSPAGSQQARGLDVIVVAYGSPDKLRSALEPVRKMPVTVVDNSSMLEIRALCEEIGCKYIDPAYNGGFGAGVNVGLSNRQVGDGDVLLLNPDAVISAPAISELQAALLADDRLASVGPRQVDESGEPVRVTWPFPSPLGIWLDAIALSRLRSPSQYVSGAILLLRAEAIEQVGQFDESFFLYAEEADWQYRASRLGWAHSVISTVTAMHEGAGTSSNEAKRLAHFHGSNERFLRKHYGTMGWQCARVGQVFGDLSRALVRRGETRARLLERAKLYLRGPLRVEAPYRGVTRRGGKTHAV